MHDEPLLPTEPPRRRHPLLVLLVCGAALASGVVLAALLLGKKPADEPEAPVEIHAASGPKTPAGADRTRGPAADDGFARDLSARAEARARAEAKRSKLEREFEEVRRKAGSLADSGRFAEALQALGAFPVGDDLRASADAESTTVENACREAYNRLVAEANELVRKGEYESAATRFDALRQAALPEVATRCGEAVSQLRAAGLEASRWREARKSDEAARAVRQGPAAKILALVRTRRYEEALRNLDAALADSSFAPVRAALEEERGAVAAASAFWDGFQRALRARVDQTLAIPLSDGTRIAGKLTPVLPDRAVLESGDVSLEARSETIHLDPVVAWTVGKTLPEEPATYVKAALFFFCEGRDDLARLYFATAREMGLAFEPSERVFRSGFLRAASAQARATKRTK